MSAWWRFLGRLGRRYWVERVSRALNRAHEQGLIDSFVLHALDHRIKYSADPGAAYPTKPRNEPDRKRIAMASGDSSEDARSAK